MINKASVVVWIVGTFLLLNMYVKPYLQNWFVAPAQQDLTKPINHTMQHLAIIMDGNRRWAKEKGYKVWIGHQKGVNPVKMTVEFCIEQKIPHLSLYAFSIENLQRSPEELDHLFEIIEQSLSHEDFEKLYQNGVKVKIIGVPELFPQRLVDIFEDIQEKTKNGTKLILNISFCYGGQQELTDTMKRIGQKIEHGQLRAQDITQNLIQQHLWTHESPNPDLIIRTGSHKRLSNFLPWQSTYSELLFLDTYWPDITKQHLYCAIENYTTIQRNFGR